MIDDRTEKVTEYELTSVEIDSVLVPEATHVTLASQLPLSVLSAMSTCEI